MVSLCLASWIQLLVSRGSSQSQRNVPELAVQSWHALFSDRVTRMDLAHLEFSLDLDRCRGSKKPGQEQGQGSCRVEMGGPKESFSAQGIKWETPHWLGIRCGVPGTQSQRL